MRNTSRFLALLLTLLLGLSLAISPAIAEDGGRKSLIMFDADEWIGTDMLQVDSWPYSQVIMADTLFVTDPITGEMLPGICSAYSYSDDGLTMTMTLPEGLYYANGEQLEPEDVVASLLHGRELSSFAYGYDGIIDMEVDGRDIICTLDGFRSDLEHFLSSSFVGVIDKDQLDSMTDEELLWGALPYGPFYLEEFVPGSHVELAVNTHYKTHNPLVENKGVPNLEKVTVRFAGEDFTLQQGIRTGDIDFIMKLSSENYAELQGAEGVVLAPATGPNIGYIELAADNEHFQDIRVRQAIGYLIDREDIAEMSDGAVVPSYALVFRTVKNYSQEAWDDYEANYCNDADKAHALLAEAGYEMGSDGYYAKDGKRLEFIFKVRDSNPSLSAGQAMQIQFKEAGIHMELESMDWSYVNEAVVSGEFDMGFLNLGWSEPILLVNRFTRGPLSNPDPDTYYALVETCTKETDNDKRTEYIYELQKMLFDYATVMPLFSSVNYAAYREDVEGIVITERADLFLNDVK
ncbi:ABC transporter substrate-binding protein [Eubacteriales bacterium OttesenSCG-928-A19]|nr:ABC transporter substrate-binding protein [Eubacteriales bacterium OttesenSCG-928-A19]